MGYTFGATHLNTSLRREKFRPFRGVSLQIRPRFESFLSLPKFWFTLSKRKDISTAVPYGKALIFVRGTCHSILCSLASSEGMLGGWDHVTARWLTTPEELPGGPPNRARREKDHLPSHQQATRLHLRRYTLAVPLSHQLGILTYIGDSRAIWHWWSPSESSRVRPWQPR
jgi:hypothetical protein